MQIDWDKDKAYGTSEASDMGFGVGVWPNEFVAEGRTFRKHTTTRDNDNDIVYVTYVNGDGTSINVYND